MARSWSVDLGAQNETVRMDPARSKGGASASASSVYRLETLVRLMTETDGDSAEQAKFAAVSSSTGLCIIVDNQLHLLDASCTRHLATINFGAYFVLLAASH